MRRLLLLLSSIGFIVPTFAATRQEVSLNGAWEMVKVRSLDAPPPASGWQPFNVPGVVSGHDYERAWFRRKFSAPSQWQGKRVFVHFGGVKYHSRVFVNGQHVGGCFNGYDAFELDVTDAVRFGAENELRVGVHDWTGIFTGAPVNFGEVRGRDELRSVPRDRLLAPIGGHFSMFGLWDDVTLRVVPPVHFREIFVRPSVRKQRLEVDVTVVNAGCEPFAGTIEGRIFPYDGSPRDADGQWQARGKVAAVFPAMKVGVSPGQQKSLTLRLNKPPLQWWSPHQPRLYVLELRFDKSDSDVRRERIGFRELWVQGGDFYFNGAKIHLLATSWWPPTTPPATADIAAQMRAIKRMNAFCFRTHTQPWQRRWYEVADEVGLLMIPEGAVWNDDDVYRVNDPVFWQNYAAHLKAMVRTLRNHPSVVMWSLENEFYGARAKDNTPVEDELARLGTLVKREDPTRPITYESDGDPGGVADVIGLHYPNEYPERRLWPNDAFWMGTPRLIHGGGGMFWDEKPFLWDRRKPLYIGEYLWVPSRDPAPHTVFFGDEAYKDHAAYRTLGKAFAWRMQMLAYRHDEVSGQSPWTVIEHGPLDERNPCWVAHRDLYRPLAAFLREFDSRFFAGETVTRTVEIFNDTFADQPRTQFHWSLWDGKKAVAQGSQTMDLKSGDHREWTLRVLMPRVQARTRLTLRLTLRVNGAEHFREDYAMDVFPRPQRWSLPNGRLFLYDPKGSLRRVWERDKVPFRGLDKDALLHLLEFEWDRLKDGGILVIGPGALTRVAGQESTPIIGVGSEYKARLDAWLKAHWRVLVLEQTDAASDWLPVRLSGQSSTMAFPQMPSHPVLRGLSAEDFRWWRGDHLVSHHEPLRPVQGGGRALVVSGTEQGLSHAPLLEVPQGDSVYLLCQLQVVSKLETEPVARLLLERMIHYLATYSPPRGATLCFGPPALQQQLTRLGVEWRPLKDWRSLRSPDVQLLILQADGETLAQHAATLRSFLEAGGQVFVHRPPPQDFDRVRAALHLPLEMQPYRGPALRAEGVGAKQIASPLLESLTREDLYWLERHEGSPWSSTPLASDAAEGIFARRVEVLGGTTFEAERDVELEGAIVWAEGEGVLFATVGRGHWKLNLPETGSYVLGLTASGTPVDNVYPMAEVFLDDQRIGALYVGSRTPRLYTIPFQAKAGEHRLTVAFTNDANRPPEDRNLFVDKFVWARDTGDANLENLTVPAALVRLPVGKGNLILSAVRWDDAGRNQRRAQRFVSSLLTSLGARFRGQTRTSVVEAERMEPQPNLPWFRREADHVYMGSSGYMEGRVRVAAAGRYRVWLWARGTPADDEYPIVALELNGKEIGRVECASDDWSAHLLTVELPEGEFVLRLRFTNDRFGPTGDRNVWIDRLEFERVSEEG